MDNNEIKKIRIKNRMSYGFDDIIKSEVFNFHKILTDKKSNKNILIYDILYKTLIVQNLCVLDSIK